MGKKDKTPVTMAIRALRAARVDFSTHIYRYEERGGTAVSSRELSVDEHTVIKTLVLEDEHRDPLIMLMHGDLEVATGLLAAAIGCKKVTTCDPTTAEKQSGYQVGGTSPFGLRNEMPIYAEASIQKLDRLYVNGGKRGFLVGMAPDELTRVLEPIWVEAAHDASLE